MQTKASISFGMVYIPVKLETAVRESDISFRQLHRESKKRIRYVKTCDDCGEVKQKDIVKAYEYEKGRYVVFEDAELEALKSGKNKAVSLQVFINLEDIDPVYFDKTYYVYPDGSDKAYELLRRTLFEQQKAGIAKYVMNYKEKLVVLRAKERCLMLSTLFFFDEVQAAPSFLQESLSGQETELAALLVSKMSGVFDPRDYKDEYKQKLQAQIEQKVSGKEITAPPSESANVTVDLLAALTASIDGAYTH